MASFSGNISVTTYGPWTKNEDGRHTRTSFTTAYRVDLDIDVRAVIETLGSKAALNKSKKSHDLGGLVTATVRKII